MNIDLEVELLVGKDVRRVKLGVVKIGIERAVGELTPNILHWRHVFGKDVDRAAKRRRSDGRGSAWAAIEIDSAEELSREEGPGVMRRRVGVVERDTIEVNVVIAIGKAAKVGLALAQANSVAVQGKRPGCHRDRFTVVGHRRSEVLNKGRADISA